jgi:hypothetical protein
MCKVSERIKAELTVWQQTGVLPPAWEPEPGESEVSDEEFDRRVDEINRELDALDALESGCLDTDDPRHPGHPVTCRRACCRPLSWEP